MNRRPGSMFPAVPMSRRRLCATLLAGAAIHVTSGCSMATSLPTVAHTTGRFDDALPAPLKSSGSQLNISLIDVDQSPLAAGALPALAWKARLAAALAPHSGSRPAGVLTRGFELPGGVPAAWMRLTPSRPDLVTLLAQRAVPPAGVAVSMEVEGTAGREPLAEGVFADLAKSWVPGSPQGFSTGTGAFVIQPSRNERASESFAASGIEVSIQTETVEEPDDGESSLQLPEGAHLVLKQHRNVGGFDGVERRVRLADEGAGARLSYMWIFAGNAADGTAPRIRLSATALAPRAGALDETWNALLSTWRLRPVGVR